MPRKRKDNNLSRKNSRSQKITEQRQQTLIEENRQGLSSSQCLEIKRRRMQETRAMETPEETEARRNANRLRQETRAMERPEDSEARRNENQMTTQETHAMERTGKREARRNVNRLRIQKSRAMETPQETEAQTNTDRLRKQDSRENTLLPHIQQRKQTTRHDTNRDFISKELTLREWLWKSMWQIFMRKNETQVLCCTTVETFLTEHALTAELTFGMLRKLPTAVAKEKSAPRINS
ncbi:Hypothetical predicted protein [Octopus vulgaris]|uniref:Uncharacterized protein n=1 Tax=Octopus vulgaris TaxID=6645 RepID=A0AA36ASM3_OCTVU|nr:Hypothetical predicted protein [Octopus vulgaris]